CSVETNFEELEIYTHSYNFIDVSILKRTKARINDCVIVTRVNKLLTQGTIYFILDDKLDFLKLMTHVYNPKSELIQEEDTANNYSFTIKTPQLWSNEDPTLYTLTHSKETEVITQIVGIREIQIKNNQFYINGQSIKFRGTNYHDSDPHTGYVM